MNKCERGQMYVVLVLATERCLRIAHNDLPALRRVGNSVPSAGAAAEQRYTVDGNEQTFNSVLSAETGAQ